MMNPAIAIHLSAVEERTPKNARRGVNSAMIAGK
jgi:hypothetical protein